MRRVPTVAEQFHCQRLTKLNPAELQRFIHHQTVAPESDAGTSLHSWQHRPMQ
jgi:hypothetical protein